MTFPCDHCGWMPDDCTCPQDDVTRQRLAAEAHRRHIIAVARALMRDLGRAARRAA